MTPLERVRRARRTLAEITVASALLWGMAVGLALHAALATIAGRSPGEAMAAAAGAALVAGALLWRGRAVWSLERTALWVEARAPELQYALVTAIEPRAAHAVSELARVVDRVDVGSLVRRAGTRAMAWAAGGLVVGGLLALAAPVRGSASTARRGTGVAPATEVGDRLVPLLALIAPPAYAHQAASDIREPSTIAALVGSVIELRGHGDGHGLRAAMAMGTDSVAIASNGAEWSARVMMPAASTAIRLQDRQYQRLVGLDPTPDSPPTVTLAGPVHDSTLRSAVGALTLVAQASDDIGLHDGHFELIVSAGDQEGAFTSREWQIGEVALANARHATMQARVDLARLGLTPGGLLSIRAVARDGNTVSGPGLGTSETRTFRVAKAEEYEAVAVESAPPPVFDSAYMSQRVIVMQTWALMRRASLLRRDTVVRRAAALADQEELLRSRVQTLLGGASEDEGGGGDGPMLLPEWQRSLFDTAYQAMGDASAALSAGKMAGALAPELVALRVLDKARVAARVYVRGAPPAIVVNTDRVRLAGTEKANAGPRPPTPSGDTAARAAMARLEAAARLAEGAPMAAADSMVLLRAAVLGRWPAGGAALADAVAALRAYQDPASALARARRAIVGPAAVDQSLPMWDGGTE